MIDIYAIIYSRLFHQFVSVLSPYYTSFTHDAEVFALTFMLYIKHRMMYKHVLKLGT